MLVASYNNQAWNDLLIIQLKPSDGKQLNIKSTDNVTVIYGTDDAIVGLNIFDASNWLDGLENGPVTLTQKQVDIINTKLAELNLGIELEADTEDKFVVGYVKTCRPHEDSDHLNITETLVGQDEVLQIVCGASNIVAGQKVVVAKPGAIMPNGLVIWPGELRGIASQGMICSAKELNLPEERQTKGILVLPDSAEVGKAFEF